MPKPKNYKGFKENLYKEAPPSDWPVTLQGLWWDAKENWYKAHSLVDGSSAPHADWVHAYLHRKEGDEWNAGYWYRRANRDFPKITLMEEHKILVEFLLLHD